MDYMSCKENLITWAMISDSIETSMQSASNAIYQSSNNLVLDKEMLAEGFTLKGKAYDIDFAAADDEIREIDVREQDGGLPKVFKMESAEQRYFKEWFNNLPPESRVRQCKDMMFNQLNKLNMVDAAELKAYINRIVDDMDKAQLAAMEKAPLGYAAKIRAKIETLLEAHYRETFDKWLETERIVCMPYFRLRPSIHPATYTDIHARSLYAAEDGDMNKLEQKLIVELTALPNVRWWHRKRLSMRSVSVFTRSHIALTSRSAVNTSP